MLRIFLILTVVAGLAAGGIALTRVSDKISTLSTELADTTTQRDRAVAGEQTARRELTATRETLATTTVDLETAREDLEFTEQRANQQESRANKLEQQLEVVTRDRNEAQTELARWQAFNMEVEQIRNMITDNRRLVDENVGLIEENRVLNRTLTGLIAKLEIYEGRATKVALPPQLRGQVVAVDPVYDFIVLNIGEEDGVLERGEMLVNRGGRLVAKVRILSVDSDRSIANVLPDWREEDVLEGDTVIVGL
jgi:multidrug efflux pump subunit AcrA (membrane-fusion protein)